MHTAPLSARSTHGRFAFSPLRSFLAGSLLPFFIVSIVSFAHPQTGGSEAASRLGTQYVSKQWTQDDGLPQNSVNAILQTRDGYLWLATQEGLVRFDGARFVVFDRSNTSAFRSNYIWSLYEDKDGILWIGTRGGGLVRFDSDRFTPYATGNRSSLETIGAICEDASGGLWVGSTNGLYMLKSDSLKPVAPPAADTVLAVTSLFCDNRGRLWVGTLRQGIYCRDGDSFTQLRMPDASKFAVSAFAEAPDSSLWIGTDLRGLLRLAGKGIVSTTTRQGLPSDNILSLLSGEDGLLVGTAGGLCRVSGNRASLVASRSGLPGEFVKALCRDREGSIWVGSYRGGLTRLRPAQFTTYTTREGLSNDFVLTVCQDLNGDLWMGTYGGGVNRLSRGRVRVLSHPQGLPDSIVSAVYPDRQGGVWIGTYGGGLVRYQENRMVRWTKRDGLASDYVVSLFQSKSGVLWVGTTDGLCSVLKGRVASPADPPTGLRTEIIALAEDRAGTLWIGTVTAGIFTFNGQSWAHLCTNEGLGSEAILSIRIDGDDHVWVGTEGGGLHLFTEGRFKRITHQDGLFDDTIFEILEDDQGYLWMSCNKGIFRSSKSDLIAFMSGSLSRIGCTSYGTTDGMVSNECNGRRQPSGWKASDGTLWFPTIKGVAAVDPSSMRPNEMPPPVVIEYFMAGDDIQRRSGEIRLPPRSRRIEIRYAAPTFLAPAAVQFRYRLEGFDPGWFEAGNRHSAVYTNLPAGEYLFRVIAANRDGVWNMEGASLAFSIRPYFYESAVFYGIVAGVLLLTAFLIFRYRERRSSAREAELVAIVDERTRTLIEEKERSEQASVDATRQRELAEEANKVKSQLLNVAAHDLKRPLISIKGFADILQHDAEASPSSKDIVAMIHQLSANMLHSVNRLLDSATLERDALVLYRQLIDMSRLAEFVGDSQRPQAEAKQQTIDLNLEPFGRALVNADEARLRDAIDNLVSNAIKFSPRGSTVRLTVQRRFDVVRCEVSDQGPGLTEDDHKQLFQRFSRLTARPTGGETSTGFGLWIVKQIVDLHGGRVWAESSQGSGSTFVIEIPAYEEHFPGPRNPGAVSSD